MLEGECIVVGSALKETAAASAARISYSDDAQVLVEGPASLSNSSLPRSRPGRKDCESGMAVSPPDFRLASCAGCGLAAGASEAGTEKPEEKPSDKSAGREIGWVLAPLPKVAGCEAAFVLAAPNMLEEIFDDALEEVR
jgi:hypothetical protein